MKNFLSVSPGQHCNRQLEKLEKLECYKTTIKKVKKELQQY